ncbi:hypothetical protein JCM15765_26130 [Paradesulfitobacterium aromaticivorans]
MSSQSPRLMWKFFLLYLGVSLFGATVITLGNIFVNGAPLEELRQYDLKALSFQVSGGVIIFQLFTLIRLRPVLRYFRQLRDKAAVSSVWNRLIRFPAEMFWGMVIFGLIVSPLYHIFDHFLSDPAHQDLPWEDAIAILYEQTLSLTLAILFFILIRRLLRPYILSLPTEGMREFPKSTFLTPLLISFTCLMLIAILLPTFYVLRIISAGAQVNVWMMVSFAGSTLPFGLTLFVLLGWQLRSEVQVLINGILSLVEGDQVWLNRRMPIMSQDEVGQLGVAFNELQERFSNWYQGVERELQLAYQVQQRLLPPSSDEIGDYRIAAVCKPIKEVGGDLYDLVKLNDDRFAVISGDVSGHGMPAALVMSAILVLFRTEVRRGGSGAEVLTRLNHSVVETLQGDMFVTLGIAIFDRHKSTCEYASAGHMAPYMLRGGQVRQIPCSSLPLGIGRDETYLQVVIPVQPGDRFVFYTDGVVEAMQDGKMLGFEGFEESLARLHSGASAEEQLNALVKGWSSDRESHSDDRTIILVEYQQAATRPESKRDAG